MGGEDRVIIVGAGIGGLMAAIALGQRGVDVLLLEQMPQMKELGAGLSLAMNAKAALRRVGLVDEVQAAGNTSGDFVHRTRTGRQLAVWRFPRLEERLGESGTVIARPTLQRILLGALGPRTELRLGARLVGVEIHDDHVIADLEGGGREAGGVLIGADGAFSTVRPLFDQTPLRYAGFTAWRGLARLDAAAANIPLGVQSQSYGRGTVFGMIPLGPDLIYWFATRNAPPGGQDEPGGRIPALLELFSGWHEPVAALIAASDEQEISRADIHDLPRREVWGRGRVTLLGDAAHPTTPTLGQGACLALEDGVVLARHLGAGGDPAAALRAYEGERIPRAAWTVERSRARARSVQADGALAMLARDTTVRLTPVPALVRVMERVFRFDG